MAYLKSTTAYVYDNLNAPAGTKMIFQQTASPTGWTKVTGTGDDHALRLTTGTCGTGGDVDFETAFADKTVTPTGTSAAVSATTLATADIPAHTHRVYSKDHTGNALQEDPIYCWSGTHWSTNMRGFAEQATDSGWGGEKIYAASNNSGNQAQGGGSHTHSMTQPTISAVPIDVNVKFVDVIVATKD